MFVLEERECKKWRQFFFASVQGELLAGKSLRALVVTGPLMRAAERRGPSYQVAAGIRVSSMVKPLKEKAGHAIEGMGFGIIQLTRMFQPHNFFHREFNS